MDTKIIQKRIVRLCLFRNAFTIGIAGNGQGLLQGWNSLLVRPEPLLNKDIKVQVNKQKPNPDSYRDTSSPDEAQQR
jgi:hypothetical protein